MKIYIKFDKFSFKPLFESGGGFDGRMSSEVNETFDIVSLTWLGIRFDIEYNFKEYI